VHFVVGISPDFALDPAGQVELPGTDRLGSFQGMNRNHLFGIAPGQLGQGDQIGQGPLDADARLDDLVRLLEYPTIHRPGIIRAVHFTDEVIPRFGSQYFSPGRFQIDRLRPPGSRQEAHHPPPDIAAVRLEAQLFQDRIGRRDCNGSFHIWIITTIGYPITTCNAPGRISKVTPCRFDPKLV
jgi:hypothetical protein